MVKTPSTEDLAAILIGHGIVDFVSGGRLTKIERNALWKMLKKSITLDNKGWCWCGECRW